MNQVESATLRRLLIKRYIQNLTWEKIAEQLNYSYKHVVHILHPKALSAIKRVLEKIKPDFIPAFLYAEFYKNP